MSKKTLANEPQLGYRHLPQLSRMLAVGYLIFPAVMWWQMRHAPAEAVSDLMSPMVFAQELFCAMTAATALLWVTRPSLFYLIFLTVYFLGFKVYQFSNQALDTPWEVAGTMFWFAAPAVLLTSQARLAYLEPARRWWRRSDRVEHATGGQILVNGVKFPVVMMNLSAGGAFVKLDERIFQTGYDAESEKRKDALGRFPSVTSAERLIAVKNMGSYPKIHDVVHLTVETLASMDSPFHENQFEVTAEVVWTTKATDPYQNGLGLKFHKVSLQTNHRLRKYLRLFPKTTD